MSDLNYRQKSSKASKYVSTVKNDFKGENKALVEMLIKEAFIAGLDVGLADVVNKSTESSLYKQNVSQLRELLIGFCEDLIMAENRYTIPHYPQYIDDFLKSQ